MVIHYSKCGAENRDETTVFNVTFVSEDSTYLIKGFT